MTIFIIIMVRLGQRLQDERKKRGLTLAEVSGATKIRSEFLSAIESGNYTHLPSAAYALGFVQNYANYLGFPKKETLALFRREFDEQKTYKVLPKGLTHEESFKRQTLRVRRRTLGIIFIFIFLLGYLVFQYRSVFFNPPLSISMPKEGSRVKQDVQVIGSTDPNAVVLVNGDMVAVDASGIFVKSITLQPGKSDINVTAKSKYGKETSVDRLVTVSP
ncbi:MAG TPA: helix-turn-helix domain-containing protein [Patescibacteria group bacterium]|nr:helix-turn-helix domain-containing protein [Patescibacteria group bacterium]